VKKLCTDVKNAEHSDIYTNVNVDLKDLKLNLIKLLV
jgi:hypothetical protein